jgi:hypothetical protein
MVAYPWEAEWGGLQEQGQPGLYNEAVSQRKKTNKQKNQRLPSKICKDLFFFFFLCHSRAWTQGLELARQALYHLSHSASPAKIF